MRTAFKEWAVVVDALARGDQIIILRKGGIDEGPDGFRVDHPRFWFFPTAYHQQRDSVIARAQARCDQLSLPAHGSFRLEFWAEVVCARRLETLAAARRLEGQHIWRPEVIAERFDWGRHKAIYALAVRVSKSPAPVDLPDDPAYAGCKSWIELNQDLTTTGSEPVLDEAAFTAKLEAFSGALDLTTA
jgi:hypothetical protein